MSLVDVAGLLVALVVATGRSMYNTKYPRTPSTAFQQYQVTTLGRLFDSAAAEHPGESGVFYMRYGRKALEARLALADLAERSLDLQYYIWDADVTGPLLANRIITELALLVHSSEFAELVAEFFDDGSN